MPEPPLISEYARAFLAPEAAVVQHVLYHIDNSDLFVLVSAVRALSIAAALPLVDASLAREHLTLTAADHVDHHVPADRADELVDNFSVLFDRIVGTESLRIVADFGFDDALDFSAHVGYELYRALLALLLVCGRGDSDPWMGLIVEACLRNRIVRVDHSSSYGLLLS